MEDENLRKIFVGGLHLATTDESLRTFYSQWGDVTECVVMRDRNTQKSRGFGFVTFVESRMIDDCLAARPHNIDGKDVECKRAIPREGMSQALPELHVTSNKLFIGNLKDEIQEEHIREYFSQFGAISSVDIITERETGKRRGFGFVLFEDYDPVDKVILSGQHEICGVKIGVKKALEREQKEIIAAGGTVRGGRGRAGQGAVARGGRGAGMKGGGQGVPGYSYFSGGDAYGGSAFGVYGFGADPYGVGYTDGSWSRSVSSSYGGWQQGGAAPAWNAGYSNFSHGQGYNAAYGGGTIKVPNYSQRATGPYGGGFGSGGAAAPTYGGPAPYGGGF